MNERFEMVAKTFQGLEGVLAEELRNLGATNVLPGKRMVAFEGDLETLYKANLCCRTALRILKPFYKFTAYDADKLYDRAKEFDWSTLLDPSKTFAIDTVVFSDEFKHSRFVTYRIKDAIVDWFKDRYGENTRPSVRLTDADVMINVHISGTSVTLSLDSSGESLHKRGYRKAQTEAPINEVLAAGIIMLSGWKGETPLVDPMCGSGTFLIEAALIAANINPGIYRRGFAFERWQDFDQELFDRLYNDDSNEREVPYKIYGADILPSAVKIAQENIKSAGVSKYIELQTQSLSKWTEAPQPAGTLVMNPPYGERISAPDMDALYELIGTQLKHVFKGYQAWIIGYREEYFHRIGLAPSEKIKMYNGALECELRQYTIFEGDKKSFLASGGKLKSGRPTEERGEKRDNKRSEKRDSKHGEKRDSKRGEKRGEKRFDRSAQRDNKRPARKFSERTERPETHTETPATESENPLAKRHNPNALKTIIGRTPSLPADGKPIMRSRGWKKK
jgi:putative N6-adenine-specific DNA methylase